MKNSILFIVCLLSFQVLFSQQTYTVEGETYELKTEISGNLTLLWNTIDNEFRYFIKKGTTIIELVNTKGDSNGYGEEYKKVLAELTADKNMSTDKLKLTLPSLRDFVFNYNKASDPSYSQTNSKAKIKANILVFGGISNSPFIENPENNSNPVFGAEIEVYEGRALPRHSIYLQIKRTTSSDDFNYSNTLFGLGYRFRFINTEKINVYANVMMATYNFSETEVMNEEMLVSEKSNGFDAPLYFGVGTDIRITPRSFITITYDELVAISLENQGNFSTNLSLGYKLKL